MLGEEEQESSVVFNGHARFTLGQCGFSSLPAILREPKYQQWESPRFGCLRVLLQGMEKVGLPEGRRPASGHTEHVLPHPLPSGFSGSGSRKY